MTRPPNPSLRELWSAAAVAGRVIEHIRALEREWHPLLASTAELSLFHAEDLLRPLLECLGLDARLARGGFRPLPLDAHPTETGYQGRISTRSQASQLDSPRSRKTSTDVIEFSGRGQTPGEGDQHQPARRQDLSDETPPPASPGGPAPSVRPIEGDRGRPDEPEHGWKDRAGPGSQTVVHPTTALSEAICWDAAIPGVSPHKEAVSTLVPKVENSSLNLKESVQSGSAHARIEWVTGGTLQSPAVWPEEMSHEPIAKCRAPAISRATACRHFEEFFGDAGVLSAWQESVIVNSDTGRQVDNYKPPRDLSQRTDILKRNLDEAVIHVSSRGGQVGSDAITTSGMASLSERLTNTTGRSEFGGSVAANYIDPATPAHGMPTEDALSRALRPMAEQAIRRLGKREYESRLVSHNLVRTWNKDSLETDEAENNHNLPLTGLRGLAARALSSSDMTYAKGPRGIASTNQRQSADKELPQSISGSVSAESIDVAAELSEILRREALRYGINVEESGP